MQTLASDENLAQIKLTITITNEDRRFDEVIRLHGMITTIQKFESRPSLNHPISA